MRPFTLYACLWTAACSAWAASVADTPFRNNVNFYLVNAQDEAFTVRVLTDAQTETPDRRGFKSYLMIRVYGPKDRLLFAKEARLLQEQRAELKLTVPSAGPGVYVLMLTGGAPDWVGIKLEPSLPYGVMGRTRLGVRGSALAKKYVYIPRNCRDAQFKIEQRPSRGRRTMVLFDEKNVKLGAVRTVRGFSVIRVEPKARDLVWRIEILGRDPYEFNCAGLPAILCPDCNVAKAIKASAIYLDDVTVQHHWQADMWKLLKAISPEGLAVEAQPLDADAFLNGDRRAAMALGLYGPLSNVSLILPEQNLDPSHHWFGSIGAWQQAALREEPLDRWDGAEGPGYLNTAGAAGVLAWAYSTDIHGNPYYRQKGLLYRALAASFLHYLTMTEAEEIAEPGLRLSGQNNWQRYHFRYLSDGPAVIFYLQDELPPEAKELWLEAIRRQVERLAYFPDWTTSQWAVTILGHYFAAAVTDDTRSRTLWRRHVECVLTDDMSGRQGQAKAGYFRESRGPDGGYNSMSMFYLGCLYRLSQEPSLLTCLQRSWELRAHMTLPEPDGQLLSPTNFNSRTGTSFARPFWPDAALHAGWVDRADDALLRSPPHDPTIPWTARTQADIENVVRYWTSHSIGEWNPARVCGSFSIGSLLSNLVSGALPTERVALPMEREEPFVRNFGDEFVCVRRPAYYAVVYTAPRGEELQMGKVMQGGGLSAFWTPACGTVLYSVNDGPWFNHAVTGERASGDVLSSSFSNQRVKLDASEGILTASAEIPSTPLRYKRTYRFDDTSLAVTLTVTSSKDWSCQALYEVIPYLSSERKKLVRVGPGRTDLEFTTDSPQEAVGFGIVCPGGRIDVEFASAANLVSPAGAGRSSDGQARHVLITLPTAWRAGQTEVLSYVIQPRTEGVSQPAAAAE